MRESEVDSHKWNYYSVVDPEMDGESVEMENCSGYELPMQWRGDDL